MFLDWRAWSCRCAHISSSSSVLWPLMTLQMNLEGCVILENPPRTLLALDLFRFRVLHHLVDVQSLRWFKIFSTGDAGERFRACMDLSVLLQLLHLCKCLVTRLTEEAAVIFSVGEQVSLQFVIAWESQTAPTTRPMFCNLGFLNWPRRLFFYFHFLSF